MLRQIGTQSVPAPAAAPAAARVVALVAICSKTAIFNTISPGRTAAASKASGRCLSLGFYRNQLRSCRNPEDLQASAKSGLRDDGLMLAPYFAESFKSCLRSPTFA